MDPWIWPPETTVHAVYMNNTVHSGLSALLPHILDTVLSVSTRVKQNAGFMKILLLSLKEFNNKVP
jgi:hypothetical protein